MTTSENQTGAETGRLFVADDADDQPTVWITNPHHPLHAIALLRRFEIPEPGRDALWRLIDGAIEEGSNDTAILHRLECRLCNCDEACVLAPLTEENRHG